MRRLHLFSLILFALILLPVVNSDVVSVNSGGGNETVINPNELIEGFFSGIPTVGPICGNGVCETGEDQSNCPADCGTPGGGDEGGGGGGGEVTANIIVNPDSFNLNLAVNTTTERIIKITSIGNSSQTFSIFASNLDEHIILNETSMTLAPGEAKELKVIFVAGSTPGIYTGLIIIDGLAVTVSLNVKTKLLLFDSNIIVLNKDYLVPQGDKLRTRVDLIPLGEEERLDVTLYYVIKDYQGRTYLTRSETLLVENQINFDRDFNTGSLPLGKYIIGLELVYPNGVAPSSAHFEVTPRRPVSTFGKIVFFLIILILLILLLLIILLLKRERDKKKQEEENEEPMLMQ